MPSRREIESVLAGPDPGLATAPYHARDHRSRLLLLPNRSRFLALAGAEIIQLRPAGPAFLFHFHFRDARRVDRENALDAFAVGNAPDGKCLIQPAAFPADDDSGKNLNPLFIAFHDPSVDADAVADLEVGHVGPELFLFD